MIGWPCDTYTPHAHQTNRVAERTVRLVKDGGRCALEQSGLRPNWRTWACLHFCAMHNERNGAFAKRHGEDPTWLRIPFGAMVDFMPTPNQRPPAFDPRCKPWLCLGYHIHAGGKWSGDYFVADWEALRKNPDSEPRSVRVQRIPEVIPIGRLDDLSFPPGGL